MYRRCFKAMMSSIAAALFALVVGPASHAAAQACVYVDDSGAIVSAPALKEVPPRFRAKATCIDKQPQEVGDVDSVALRGQERTASFSTSLGNMEVRWPRQIERCFGKSPARAVTEASTAVNRAIRNAAFDSAAKVKRDWAILLIDRASAVSQFPIALSLGGHPGFMVPPNQIYIVTDYVSPNCQASEQADARLVQVLLHEMGHVIEFSLLDAKENDSDRKRAEGFAAWFEGYSAKYSSAIPDGSVQRLYRSMIQSTDGVGGRSFSGSGEDYAIASLEFEAIVNRKGVSGLMDIYSTMVSERCSFYEALKKRHGWDQRTLAREVQNLNPS